MQMKIVNCVKNTYLRELQNFCMRITFFYKNYFLRKLK